MRTTFLMLAFIAAATGFFRLAKTSSRSGESTPVGSTLRFDPYGTAGFYRLLKARNTQANRLKRPSLIGIAPGSATLIQVLPNAIDELDESTLGPDLLLPWVEQGNTLIQLSPWETQLSDELGIQHYANSPAAAAAATKAATTAKAAGQQPQNQNSQNTNNIPAEEHQDQLLRYQKAGLHPDKQPTQTAAATTDHFTLAVRAADDFTTATAPVTVLAINQAEQPIALSLQHGQGRVILISSASLINNWDIQLENNLAFVLSLIDESHPVWFDEWSHGIGHAGTILEIMLALGMGPALVLLIGWLFAYRWSQAGLPPPTFDEEQNDNKRARAQSEQIDALAQLYTSGINPAERKRRVGQEITHRLAAACHCRTDQLREKLQQHTRSKPALDDPSLAKVILQAQELAAQADGWVQQVQVLCQSCGYNLTGTLTDAQASCPECGERLPVHHEKQDTQAKPTKTRLLAQGLTDAHTLCQQLKDLKHIHP